MNQPHILPMPTADVDALQVLGELLRQGLSCASIQVKIDVVMHTAGVSPAMPSPRAPPAREYRDVEACIMEAAPGPDDRPVSIKQLARGAGYSYTLWFRKAVDALIMAGDLVRTSIGIRRSRAGLPADVDAEAGQREHKDVEVFSGPEDLPDLCAIEFAILRATDTAPATAKALARKCNYVYNSYFRNAIKRLVERSLVVRTAKGIRLP